MDPIDSFSQGQVVTYNEDTFIQRVRLAEVKNDVITYAIDVDKDWISGISIYNDLFEPFPQLKLTMIDDQNAVVPRFTPNGTWFVHIGLKCSTDTIDNDKEISLIFIVDSPKIISIDGGSVTYEIYGTLHDSIALNSQLDYSSIIEKPYTKMIQEILFEAKIPFEDPTTRNYFEESKRSGFFIFTPTMPIIDAIQYMLERGSSAQDGLYFLHYNLILKQYKILSLNKIMKTAEVPRYGALTLSSQFVLDRDLVAPKYNYSNYNGASGIYTLASKMTVHNFNYLQRQWGKETVTEAGLKDAITFSKGDKNANFEAKNITEKILTSSNEASHETLKGTSKFEKEIVPRLEQVVSQRMFQFFKMSNVLKVQIKGYIEREVGELMKVALPPLISSYNQYNGLWLVARVAHIFGKSSGYTQEMSLIRAEKLNTAEMTKTETTGVS